MRPEEALCCLRGAIDEQCQGLQLKAIIGEPKAQYPYELKNNQIP